MNLDFDADQQLIRDEARRFLTEQCNGDRVRAAMQSDGCFDIDLWRQIAELGWPALAIPEKFGGIGMGYVELCAVAEEMGRSLAPVPMLTTRYLYAEGVMTFGDDALCARWLPEVAAGDRQGALIGFGDAPRSTDLRYTSEGLHGRVALAEGGLNAGLALAVAQTSDGEPVLVHTELVGDSFRRVPKTSIGINNDLAALEFSAHPASEPLARGRAAVDALLNRAAVLVAFEQLGGAEHCMEATVAQCKERRTFGRAIGSYQAVKHTLAKMYVKNSLARSNAYYAAWALQEDNRELPVAAAAARISATDAFDFAARESLHLHGGMGFTWEMDCHLYYKRAMRLSSLLGDCRRWQRRLSAEVRQLLTAGGDLPVWLANA